MAEYWKSTPRYWCKHCKVFIRDTPFERNQHDATAKHQSSLKRFLRDIHRNNEREERDNQKAKDEVQRLSKLVSSPDTRSETSDLVKNRPSATSLPAPRALDERKRQIAQLAEMGVSIPQEFRGEIAMAGDWQTISTREIEPHDKEGEKPSALNVGVRKRKPEEQEDQEEEMNRRVVKKNWGSAKRHYPGTEEDDALDSLLQKTKDIKKMGSASESIKEEKYVLIKRETTPPPADTKLLPLVKEEEPIDDTAVASHTIPEVVFKKRKFKPQKK
ncbi:hypothetical protein Egran_05752 [Elaphomyces granulatus]|uniref:U1-type domain-containing protein n=1 Tax=Elaphomyces granulatus TaxID=519963 RepID=A0A232LQR6_9EURO|nr:hypothetical protein Egran_05752 [Elaphomyces granulatus]